MSQKINRDTIILGPDCQAKKFVGYRFWLMRTLGLSKRAEAVFSSVTSTMREDNEASLFSSPMEDFCQLSQSHIQ
jgi:hypothetical protein